ncbi:hypothetical protein Av05_00113 [Escherichia phage Av-05]|uniref:Uncharacterized protein n=1 Tax=Escherichia phage Av-05 TaxID=1527519 RepID=A0A076G5Z6_9CAUD|nr:hypothetical protein Av05_00113 [Escherichia phage Av-05]AII27656.1 hypothetical protein Av05_00113 [Escherichia phage Av-05]EHP9877550.1 hypothetical protein [Escherichia coli]
MKNRKAKILLLPRKRESQVLKVSNRRVVLFKYYGAMVAGERKKLSIKQKIKYRKLEKIFNNAMAKLRNN